MLERLRRRRQKRQERTTAIAAEISARDARWDEQRKDIQLEIGEINSITLTTLTKEEFEVTTGRAYEYVNGGQLVEGYWKPYRYKEYEDRPYGQPSNGPKLRVRGIFYHAKQAGADAIVNHIVTAGRDPIETGLPVKEVKP